MMRAMVRAFVRCTRGQDLIEYTLLLGAVSLTMAGMLAMAAPATTGIWASANSTLALPTAPPAAPPATPPPPPASAPADPDGDGR